MSQRGSMLVDVRANITGYEASLKALNTAFEKIDPGSSIGKKLARAIDYAESQVKKLSNNLTPQISSTTQLDALVTKTNAAGTAIQEVSRLMQEVGVNDIDFSRFDVEISNLTKQLVTLETELANLTNESFKNTINSSQELSDAFKNLDIDVSNKNVGQVFDAVAAKAQEAAAATEAAKQRLLTAENELTAKQNRLASLENNPVYNKDALVQGLKDITSTYTETFTNIKTMITTNLQSMIGDNTKLFSELSNQFVEGLTPETLAAHLKTLRDQLKQELSGQSGQDIMAQLIGLDPNNHGRITVPNVTRQLLAPLQKALPSIKEEFQKQFTSVVPSLTNKEAGTITMLMDEGDLDAALQATIKAVERAYVQAAGAVTKGKQEVAEAMTAKTGAAADVTTAEANQQVVASLNKELETRMANIENENTQLREEIVTLRQQINERKQGTVNEIQQNALGAAGSAEQWKMSTAEVQKYQTELDKVQKQEQLIGKIGNLVQRWFSIYTVVRMVNTAIRNVISTIQELDKTITEIAIVTDMKQSDLWAQMSSYTEMARSYAASISGVYQVSQLFYQQGGLIFDFLPIL